MGLTMKEAEIKRPHTLVLIAAVFRFDVVCCSCWWLSLVEVDAPGLVEVFMVDAPGLVEVFMVDVLYWPLTVDLVDPDTSVVVVVVTVFLFPSWSCGFKTFTRPFLPVKNIEKKDWKYLKLNPFMPQYVDVCKQWSIDVWTINYTINVTSHTIIWTLCIGKIQLFAKELTEFLYSRTLLSKLLPAGETCFWVG